MAGATALLMLAAACQDDERLVGEGEGKVVISTEILSDVKVVSRAATDEQSLRESLILWISNSKGPVRKYSGAADIPAEEWLNSGHYVAEAWAGDSVPASFDKRWFKGCTGFDVTAGQSTTVTVPCKIANVLVEVDYASDMDAVLSDYTMTVGHKRGTVTFEGADERTAYFMMPSTDKDLAWTLAGTLADGSAFERSGVIADAKPATKYVLTVHYSSEADEIGGAIIGIEVDQTEQEVYDDILIELPPIIQGYDFDITQDVTAEPGKVGRRSVFVTSSTEMTSAVVSIDGFSALLGIKDEDGSDFNDFDLITCDDTFRQHLLAAGIDRLYEYDETEDVAALKIIFDEQFTSRLDEGVYPFVITVTDKAGRKSSATFTVNVSNAPLAIAEVQRPDIWAHSAVLRASALRDSYGNASFEYRKRGGSEWIPAVPVADGQSLSASISGLEAGAVYEYRISTDIDDFVSDVMTFTTEAATQLPNAGFESWQQPANPWLLYAEDENMFWDSGNHGSTKAGKSYNITTPDSEIRHSGSYSVKMASKDVFIKFAAGNVFVGEYLATDDMDGILGWGRQFESRPTALHGYIRYVSGNINCGTPTSIPGTPVANGDPDRGIVYIALLDDSILKTESKSGKSYPVIVKTKTKELFDKNDSNVLAYGEQVWSSSTSGEGMVEFTIPLDYYRTDVIPSYIVLTCSASQYGDYFVGSDSSVMWLDDLELVYDR